MSYCRRDGITSDVYAWSDGELYHVWLDNGTDIRDDEFPDYPIRLMACNLASFESLLEMVYADGWKIPSDVFNRVAEEIAFPSSEKPTEAAIDADNDS